MPAVEGAGATPRRRGKNKKGSKKRKLLLEAATGIAPEQHGQTKPAATVESSDDVSQKFVKKRKKSTQKKQQQKAKQTNQLKVDGNNEHNEYVERVVESLLSGEGGTLSDRLNHTHQYFDANLKEQWKSLPKRLKKVVSNADQGRLQHQVNQSCGAGGKRECVRVRRKSEAGCFMKGQDQALRATQQQSIFLQHSTLSCKS